MPHTDTIHFEATELERRNYSFDYDKNDFNIDVEKFQIEGIDYPTLCKILRGETPDQPIRVMGVDFYNEYKPYYASEFFLDLIRERALISEYEVEELVDSWEENTDVK